MIEIRKWLESIGLAQYADAFDGNDHGHGSAVPFRSSMLEVPRSAERAGQGLSVI
jgi:hypothetical protein